MGECIAAKLLSADSARRSSTVSSAGRSSTSARRPSTVSAGSSTPISGGFTIEGGHYNGSHGYQALPVDKTTFTGPFESNGISEFFRNRKDKSKAKYWVTRTQTGKNGTEDKYTWRIMFGDAVKFTGTSPGSRQPPKGIFGTPSH